jgi:hypothetical protein
MHFAAMFKAKTILLSKGTLRSSNLLDNMHARAMKAPSYRAEGRKTRHGNSQERNKKYSVGHFTFDWWHSPEKAKCATWQVRRFIHRLQRRDVTTAGVKVQTEIYIS